ncbi:MAG: hypothetical protein WD894_03775 [Pirellulales bacterium]
MFTAALAVISFAVLAAIFRRGAKQAFWVGFALFGWLYLWMAHWPGDVNLGPNARWRLQNDSMDTFATTRLLVYVYNKWLPEARTPPPAGYGGSRAGYRTTEYGSAPPAPYGAAPAGPATPVIDYPLQHNFTRVGHALFVIVLAFAGGAAATYLYKTREHASTDGRASPGPISG